MWYYLGAIVFLLFGLHVFWAGRKPWPTESDYGNRLFSILSFTILQSISAL